MTLQSARYHTLACHQHFFSPDAAAPSFLGGSGENKCVFQGGLTKARLFQWAQRPTAAASGRNRVTLRQAVFDLGSTGFDATVDVTEAEDVTSRGATRVDVPTLGTPCGMELPNSDRQNSPKARRSRVTGRITVALLTELKLYRFAA